MSVDQDELRKAEEAVRLVAERLGGFALGLELAAAGARELTSAIAQSLRSVLAEVADELGQIPVEELRPFADELDAGELMEPGPVEPVEEPGFEETVVAVESPVAAGPDRYCEQCGKVLVRHPPRYGRNTESAAQFRQRRFCSRECHGLSRRAVAQVPESKACERCGKPFGMQKAEGPKRFAGRRYCSKECQLAACERVVKDGTRQSTGGRRGRQLSADPSDGPVAPKRPGRPTVPVAPAAVLAPREGGALPDPRPSKVALEVGAPTPIEGTANVNGLTFDATICEQHGVQRGFYGCPACNASAARRAAERSRPITPRAEGGR